MAPSAPSDTTPETMARTAAAAAARSTRCMAPPLVRAGMFRGAILGGLEAGCKSKEPYTPKSLGTRTERKAPCESADVLNRWTGTGEFRHRLLRSVLDPRLFGTSLSTAACGQQ